MDFIAELFGASRTQAEVEAGIERMRAAEAARIADIAAERVAAVVARIALRCPRCMGEGRLPQFAHRNGGECFTCGGSGIFSRLAA